MKDGIFLELVIWEDFISAISQTRSQDEYNKAIKTRYVPPSANRGAGSILPMPK